MPSELIDVPIVRLTERAGARPTVSTNVHPKYLRRIKELRLAQPLPADRLGDLTYFTHLRQLYLDCGTDRPSTLEALPQYIAAPLPLAVIIGLSIDRRPIEFARGVTILRVYFEITSTARPLQLAADATLVEVALDRFGVLPDLSTWHALRDLEIAIEHGASARDVRVPPQLQTIELIAVACCRLSGNVEGHVPGPWTAERRDITHVRFGGDMRGFKRLMINGDVAFSGVPLTGVEDVLAMADGFSERALRALLAATPAVRRVGLRFVNGTDYVALVRDVPSIEHLDFSLAGVNQKALVETVAARLRDHGCRTTAAVSTATFVDDCYDSDSGAWQSYSSR